MPLEVLDIRAEEGVADLGRRHGGWDRPELLKASRDVQRILTEVQDKGDEALIAYAKAFDGVDLTPAGLRVTISERDEIASGASEDLRRALTAAAENIAFFHEAQRPKDWSVDRDGVVAGQVFRAIHRVGIYVPAALAPLPSSLLMMAVPARIAGVDEIVLCTGPRPDGRPHEAVMAAAQQAGVEEIYRISGAQAIGAMAYGTESVPKVEKICGPGGVYTTLAKRAVYGTVGVDGLFGPSESAVVADEDANPLYAAAELLTQAEHDPDAAAILVTTSEETLEACMREVEAQLRALPRVDQIREAFASHGLAILVRDLEQAAEVVNELAPEHLCVHVRDPAAFVPMVRAAGAILLGGGTPATLSDYCAGPSHILPTARTARFASGLSVRDFMVGINTISYDRKALFREAPVAEALAEAEGLAAHREAVRIRLEGQS